jgi:hypothetical protein
MCFDDWELGSSIDHNSLIYIDEDDLILVENKSKVSSPSFLHHIDPKTNLATNLFGILKS